MAMGTEYVPAETFSPGEFIKDELVERDWTQGDLAEIVGRSDRVISELVNAKRAITVQTAKELAAAFGTSPDVWLNLETAYQLGKNRSSDDSVQRRAKLYSIAPVKEMVKRGWVEKSANIQVLEQQVLDFLDMEDIDDRPIFAHAARKSSSYEEITIGQRAWLSRARQLAKAVQTERYSPSRLGHLLAELKLLMVNAVETRTIPARWAQAGIKFVLLEHLPSTKIDGATIWLNADEPVIVVSTRYDRIDAFWFTLMHELGHVKARDGVRQRFELDVNLIGKERSATQKMPEHEINADEFAADQIVPRAEMENFVDRTKPYYSAAAIRRFALRIKVHPGLVVGQLHHRENNWNQFNQYLEKVRQHLVESAMVDGWGHTTRMTAMG